MCDFLFADRIDGKLILEYSGLGKITFSINEETIKAHVFYAPQLYSLYFYAYDTYSPINLELVQQFISVMVRSPEELLTRANQIKTAAKKAFDNMLVSNVRDYFDTRDKIQERLRTIIEEIANSVLSTLTKGVTDDVYKAAGVVALTFITAFLNPEKTLVAFRIGFAAIAAYMVIVITYYFPTLRKTLELRLDQHNQYIRSFNNVLDDTEIDKLLSDSSLESTKIVFFKKLQIAIAIYVVALLVAVVLFFASSSIYAQLTNSSQSPPTPAQIIILTPTPLPSLTPTPTYTMSPLPPTVVVATSTPP